MPTSSNILRDIDITVEVIPDAERMNSFKSTIRAKVHCLRELSGTSIATIHLHAYAHSHSREHAIISAINEILEGNYHFEETVHHDVHCEELDYSQVHSLESHDIGEYADLFHKHFDLLKFSLPGQLQPNAGSAKETVTAGAAGGDNSR